MKYFCKSFYFVKVENSLLVIKEILILSLWINIDSLGLIGICGLWFVGLFKYGDLDFKVCLDFSICYIDVMCVCKWCICFFIKFFWIFCFKCDFGERLFFEWVGIFKLN